MLECLKAFMSSYRLKIASSITKDMPASQMVKVVVDVSLPALHGENHDKINVSLLDGVEKISLPEIKIASLFGQFLSKSANDDEIKAILKEIYTSDVEGMAKLIECAKKAHREENRDESKTAYALLAVIYGLSIFRIIGFMPSGETDNRDIAFHYVNLLLGINS